jgi:hypothetical protein
VPNPLFDIITTYDDEESSEVSLVTLILITEEKEAEKISAPSPDASVQNLPRGEHEAKSVLDIEFLNLLETLKDNIREDLGSGG